MSLAAQLALIGLAAIVVAVSCGADAYVGDELGGRGAWQRAGPADRQNKQGHRDRLR